MPAPCRRCASIDFADGAYHALSSVGAAKASSARGCAGCAFFLGELLRDGARDAVVGDAT